jgi:hypothetical protein|tara:strand:+ start:457 stop:729 length:273 start_codon:yes stop_codon:yes gene_type:complete
MSTNRVIYFKEIIMSRLFNQYYFDIVDDEIKCKAFDEAWKFGWDSEQELADKYAEFYQKKSGIELDKSARREHINLLMAAHGYESTDYGV